MQDPHPSAAPSSEEPLDAMSVCHERMMDQLTTLKRLAAHVQVSGADVPAQRAALAVIRYFDIAAVEHHEDEEFALFPALRTASLGADPQGLDALLGTLIKEHRQLASGWQRLRAVLLSIAEGQVADLDMEWVGAFEGLCDTHIQREERRLFPLATTLLDADQLHAIGASIAWRRTSGH